MKQNKWIVTSLLLGRMPVARPGSSAVESGSERRLCLQPVQHRYPICIRLQLRRARRADRGHSRGIRHPDWLAVRADFVYLQKGYSMQRAYDQGFRDRRDHYLSLPVMARFSSAVKSYVASSMPAATWAIGRIAGERYRKNLR